MEREDVGNPLIFPARRYPQGNWDASGLDFLNVDLLADDGFALHGWYFERDSPRGFLLYCHGAGENVAIAGPVVSALSRRLRLSSFVFDYRGYGRSEGIPTEEGVLSDARVARAWLCERGAITPRDVVLMGRSLGGAIAVDLAAAGGASALVVENTFTSLPELFELRAPPGLEPGASFDSLAKIRRYTGPLLVSHASDDEWVPFDLGVKLFTAHQGPKRFFRLPGGQHDTPPTPDFLDCVDLFLTDVAGLT